MVWRLWQARPCNPDGSEPCEDKRSGVKQISIEVTRFAGLQAGIQRNIYEDILRIAERRLEESPECCIKHLLMGQWDGSACILSAPREEEP